MANISVNGTIYNIDKDLSLMKFLRDDLELKSVKDGCNEGACGTCTILLNGKATKSCVRRLEKLDGAVVTTVEGLSDREKLVYSYAFAESSAVQCGFCIPGMVICAKALIDQNPCPSREEIAFAIRNNICRCTGYKKIIDAIELSAAILRGDEGMPEYEGEVFVGADIQRIDAKAKVLGLAKYSDDISMDGMCHASALRSAHPRAIVKAIDASAALEMDGVLAVFTAEDIPGENRTGHLVQDWNCMIAVGDTTRYLGDAICLVVAESEEILNAAKARVKVDYEVLDAIKSPAEAARDNAPDIHPGGNLLSHEHLLKGDANEVIAKSKYSVSEHFEVPFTEHAFLEPETSVAYPTENGGVRVVSSDQSAFSIQHQIMSLLDLPEDKVVVENLAIGGAFGGKEDATVQHEAALIAYKLKRPVKVKLTRQESIIVHPKRHAMSMDFTLACDENGNFTAMKALLISDTGAYASLGGPVLQRACTHAAGPYNYQTIDIEGKAYYTNNPPGGAFRGFGVSQSCFAIESLINLLAEKTGLDPWEIRYKNAIRPGQVLPNGQIAGQETGLVETLEAVKSAYYDNPYAGIACALKNSGVGIGIPDTGRARLRVEGGKVHLLCGAADNGQGAATVLYQMLANTIDVDPNLIVYHNPNTASTPDSGVSSASRQTLFSGEAVRLAGLKLKEAMKDNRLEDLEGREYYAEFCPKTDKMGADVPNPVSHTAYGYATHVVILDEKGMLKKVVAAHNVGKAVNPKALEGQIEGGALMSLGYALTEDYPLENCEPKVKYGSLGLFKAHKTPELESIIIEKEGLPYAYGAIGIGEITSIPTAPAAQHAYYRLDGKFRTELPLKDTAYKK